MLFQLQSLPRIEEKVELLAHEVHKVSLAVEEVKALNVELSPLLGEWDEFRQAHPDAVKAILRADEHFLAGRRDEAVGEWVALMRQPASGRPPCAG